MSRNVLSLLEERRILFLNSVDLLVQGPLKSLGLVVLLLYFLVLFDGKQQFKELDLGTGSSGLQ